VRPNLVLRAGAGIFYDLGYSTVADGARAFPFGQSKTVLNTSFLLSAIDTAPDPLTTTPPVSFLSVVDNYRTPNPDSKGQFNILSNKASSYEKYGTKAPAESIT
jgi:hypothetical protein